MTSNDNEEAARPFAAYTAADHARVVMAEAAWSTLGAAFRAMVPEAHKDGAGPGVLIESARVVVAMAQALLEAAVVASHEQGMTWAEIGRALEVSKQSAHERFAEYVTNFRTRLAEHLAKLAEDPAAELERFVSGWGMLADTAWYAPRLDEWRAALSEIPGVLLPPAKPGELLARLSDAATAVTSVADLNARPVDAVAPRCRFTAEADWREDSTPGDYLTCTLPDGHPGRHQLAVANALDA